MSERGEYKNLLRKLIALIKDKKEITSEELLEWAEEQDIGVITLQVLIDDLKSKDFIEMSSEEKVVKSLLGNVSIPSTIRVKMTKRLIKREEVRSRSIPRKRRKGISILDFVEVEESPKVEEKEPKTIEREEKKTTNLKLALDRETISKFTQKKPVKSESDEISLAISYLNRYPSVGSIRFAIDLKGMGISDPEALMRKLLDLGYIVIDELGVVNATDKLPKIDKDSIKLSNLIA